MKYKCCKDCIARRISTCEHCYNGTYYVKDVKNERNLIVWPL